MFFQAFSNPTIGKWIIPGAGFVWFLGCFFLLRYYGVAEEIPEVDALVFSVVFMGSVWVLDRLFTFFSPKGKNIWLVFALPIVLTLIAVYSHYFLLKWWFSEEFEYLVFLEKGLPLRLSVFSLTQLMVSLMALILSRLERQDQLNKREVQMTQLSKDAELAQLRQQLQPHFLFNSLNSINALVITQPKKAREMILLLSDFLRGTIRKDTQSWVSLADELNYLKMYLDIERVRFGHRLEVEFELEENCLTQKIPQLLIQPLLENAIKHGLYGVTGEVKIQFQAKKADNYLVVSVRNPFEPNSSSAEGTGFGLSSVERRLYLLFGRTDLLVKKEESDTFSVTLKIPQFL